MARSFGGHSQLGVHLNEQSQKTSEIFVKKTNSKRAVIYKSFNNTYIFKMRLLDNNKITKPIPLLGSSDELAMRFGSPEEMEGKWEVLITYKGDSVNRGIAQIIGQFGETISSAVEKTEQSNQLMVKGSAFAPPGSSM